MEESTTFGRLYARALTDVKRVMERDGRHAAVEAAKAWQHEVGIDANVLLQEAGVPHE